MTGPRDPATERLELRLNWLVLTAILVGTFLCFAVVAVALLGWPSAGRGLWVLMAAGLAVSLVVVAVATRYRLILTPAGFRTRFVSNGRLVPWTSVRRFDADVLGRGILWLPRDRPAMPQSASQWARAMYAAGNRHIALFGPSTSELLATMNEWLNRYSTPSADSSAHTVNIRIDDPRLVLDPKLQARLQELQRRQVAGEAVNVAELDRLLKDLMPRTSRLDDASS